MNGNIKCDWNITKMSIKNEILDMYMKIFLLGLAGISVAVGFGV